MTEEAAKLSAPPYVPYKTFTNFINGLGETGIPSQIDKSIMRSLSGSVQSALTSTLEYLKLIDKNGKPAPQLTQLVESKDKQRADILRSVLEKAYPFLFSGSVELKRATTKQVEDAFRDQGAGGSTVVKCIAFFLAAAKEALVEVSSHVKTPQLQRNTTPKRNAGAGASSGASPTDSDDDDGFQIPPDSKQLRLPVLGRGDLVLVVPADMTLDDWRFIEPIFKQYVERMFGADLLA